MHLNYYSFYKRIRHCICIMWFRNKIKTSFYFHLFPSNSFLVEVFVVISSPCNSEGFIEEENPCTLTGGHRREWRSFPCSNPSGFSTRREVRRNIRKSPFPFNQYWMPQYWNFAKTLIRSSSGPNNSLQKFWEFSLKLGRLTLSWLDLSSSYTSPPT